MAKALLFVVWLVAAVCPSGESFATIVPISRQSLKGRSQVEGDNLLLATPTQVAMINVAHAESIVDRAQAMNERAIHELPLTEEELDAVIKSIRNVHPEDVVLDFVALRLFLSEVAHLSHKNWTRTGINSEVLARLLIPQGMSSNARQLLARIVQEGNWDGASRQATDKITTDPPWAVLVTGVNGVRKTTSMYQPWFTSLLAEALVAPAGRKAAFDTRDLPSGQTAFFRQLGKFFVGPCLASLSALILSPILNKII